MIPSIPAEANSAECAVITTVLLDGWDAYNAARELKDKDFGDPRRAVVWRAICRLALTAPDQIGNIIAVEQQLVASCELELIGGIVGIEAQSDGIKCSLPGGMARAVAIVKLYSARRQTYHWHRESSEVIEDEAELTDPEAWSAHMKIQAAKLSSLAALGSTAAPIRSSADVAQELARKQHESVTGAGNRVSLGFPSLDALICARTRELLILGGRPSHGKSALMDSMVREINFRRLRGNWAWGTSNNPTPTLVVPAEMPGADFCARLVADLASVDTRVVLAPTADDWRTYGEAIKYARDLVAESGVAWVEDEIATELDKIESAIRHWRALNPGPRAVVFIDYLQLINARNPDGGRWGSEDQKNSTIAATLKALAKELHVLIVLISATNRNVDKRDDKWPMTSDLRYAGGVDFHADQIIFAHRPAKYGAAGFKRDEWPREVDGWDAAEGLLDHSHECVLRGTATAEQRRLIEKLEPLMRRGWIPVVKARNGKVGAVLARWDAPFARWSEVPAAA